MPVVTITHCLTILGFDWKSLKEDAVVVDVGGSVGSVTYTIFQQNKHLRYVIQDLESIINKEAKQVCLNPHHGSNQHHKTTNLSWLVLGRKNASSTHRWTSNSAR